MKAEDLSSDPWKEEVKRTLPLKRGSSDHEVLEPIPHNPRSDQLI
jgi:hypothetical protein